MAYLLHTKLINVTMPELTIFMCALKFISDTKFYSNILSFAFKNMQPHSSKSNNIATLMYTVNSTNNNSSCEYNILWRVSQSAMSTLKQCASSSLNLIQNGLSNAFTDVFMTSNVFSQQYDAFFHIPCIDKNTVLNMRSDPNLPDTIRNRLQTMSSDVLQDVDNLSAWQYTSRRAYELIVSALGDRVLAVNIMSEPIDKIGQRYNMINLHLLLYFLIYLLFV